jgi:hypothetical protein
VLLRTAFQQADRLIQLLLQFRSPFQLIVVCVVAAAGCACTPSQDQIQRHQQKLQSLASTASAIGQAWLAGTVSGTYARTALEQTFFLVEEERRGVTSAPEMVADPSGARLADAADALARAVALLTQHIVAMDADAVRHHLARIPMRPSDHR